MSWINEDGEPIDSPRADHFGRDEVMRAADLFLIELVKRGATYRLIAEAARRIGTDPKSVQRRYTSLDPKARDAHAAAAA